MRNPNLVLVDTSAWIEVLPSRSPPSELSLQLQELRRTSLVAVNGMIRLELLSGISNEAEYDRRAQLVGALDLLPTTEDRWADAARLGSELRRRGLTVPNTDLLIAAVAMASGATVLHRDRHFDLIAQHAPLAVESHLSA